MQVKWDNPQINILLNFHREINFREILISYLTAEWINKCTKINKYQEIKMARICKDINKGMINKWTERFHQCMTKVCKKYSKAKTWMLWPTTAKAIRTWCRGSTSKCHLITGCQCTEVWIYHKFHPINKCVRIPLMAKNSKNSNPRITLPELVSPRLKNLLQKKLKRMESVSHLMWRGRSK